MIARSNLQPLAPLLSDTYLESIKYGDFRRWRKRLAALPELSPSSVELGNKVRLGTATDCDEGMRAILHDQLREFIPWRKGPFSVFGITIDSEWRSDLKWNRLHEKIGSLQDRIVLDVGCSNGYYGFRMLEAGAKLVIGTSYPLRGTILGVKTICARPSRLCDSSRFKAVTPTIGRIRQRVFHGRTLSFTVAY